MNSWLTIAAVAASALFSLLVSTLTFALRDYSRPKLTEALDRRGKGSTIEIFAKLGGDFSFATAIARLLCNIFILIGVLHLLAARGMSEWMRYALAVTITGIITLFCSIALPHALAEHAGEKILASQTQFLVMLRLMLLPATRVMHAIDRTVGRLAGLGSVQADVDEREIQDIQEEILSVVEEGEKEGVVDKQEKMMIESVIHFRATQVGQVMNARPDIKALPMNATLEEVKTKLDESGHSRIPVYNGSLDQIVGVLYARDLLKHIGRPPEEFDMRSAMRPAFYVPETKALRDLLKDFREHKVHLAIVLDEYGSTAGLVSIEDVLEELVGDISDEHEPKEPGMLKRIDETVAEADARIRLDELNRALGLSLPEDAGYETLGGFISNTLGRIPQRGSTFDHPGLRFTILEAEPHQVRRARIEIVPQPVDEKSPVRL
jgi:CBS domain containing-hemolysin-like protein